MSEILAYTWQLGPGVSNKLYIIKHQTKKVYILVFQTGKQDIVAAEMSPACILNEWWITTALGSLVVWWNENTNSPAIVGLLDLSDLHVRVELWGRETLNQIMRSVVDNLV